MTKENDIIKELSSIIKNRIDILPDNSYVAKISKKGKVKVANKFGEEAFETVAAFLSEGDEELKEEEIKDDEESSTSASETSTPA